MSHARRSLRSTAARVAREILPPVLALGLLVALAAPAAAEDRVVERRYQFRFLKVADALAVAQNLCPAEGTCAVSTSGADEIRMVADPRIHEQVARALQTADVPPASQTFLLTLLQAYRGSGGADSLPADLPNEARKAIQDIASFLPYGRFELLAPVAFLRTTDDARITVGGDDQVAYELDLSFRGDPRQPGAELLIDAFRLRLVPAEPMLVALAQQPGFGPGATLPRRTQRQDGGDTPQPAPRGEPSPAPAATTAAPTPPPTVAEHLLSTSFSIRKGETVVVGTSKLRGNDQALVVLLTALP
jgi:hypothetical protein